MSQNDVTEAGLVENFVSKLLKTKNPDDMLAQSKETGLKKTLNWVDLIILGIGAVIGAGIFESTCLQVRSRRGPECYFLQAGTVGKSTGLNGVNRRRESQTGKGSLVCKTVFGDLVHRIGGFAKHNAGFHGDISGQCFSRNSRNGQIFLTGQVVVSKSITEIVLINIPYIATV